MSEWLKEHAWKACVGVTLLPWVRIPLSPPPSSRQGQGRGNTPVVRFQREQRHEVDHRDGDRRGRRHDRCGRIRHGDSDRRRQRSHRPSGNGCARHGRSSARRRNRFREGRPAARNTRTRHPAVRLTHPPTSPPIVASGSGCRPTNPRQESTPFYGADSWPANRRLTAPLGAQPTLQESAPFAGAEGRALGGKADVVIQ